jgi:hypothetical protein
MLNKNIYSRFFWGKKPAESINLLSLKFWYSQLCTWQVLGSELRELKKTWLRVVYAHYCHMWLIDRNFLWWSNRLWAAVLTRVWWPCVIDEAFFDCPTVCELLFLRGYDHVWLMKLSFDCPTDCELLFSQGYDDHVWLMKLSFYCPTDCESRAAAALTRLFLTSVGRIPPF